jgi:hypothetical protein
MMVEKFIKWFFSEVEMYGPGIQSGIFGNYIVDKIMCNPIQSIDFYVFSDSNQWDIIKENLVSHIEEVWNIFQYNKIQIKKYENLYYVFTIDNVQCRIFWEKPWMRNIYTFQTINYVCKNKKFSIESSFKNNDPLFLLKTLNNIKRKKLVSLHTKNLILDHDFFLADREHYLIIVDMTFNLLKQGWYFDHRYMRMHLEYDITKDCSICRTNEHECKLKLQCGHHFHKDCLKQLMSLDPDQKHASLCPNCRSPIQIFYT